MRGCKERRQIVASTLRCDRRFALQRPSRCVKTPGRIPHLHIRRASRRLLDTEVRGDWSPSRTTASRRMVLQRDSQHAHAAHVPSEFPKSRSFCQASTTARLPLDTSSMIVASASVWVRWVPTYPEEIKLIMSPWRKYVPSKES